MARRALGRRPLSEPDLVRLPDRRLENVARALVDVWFGTASLTPGGKHRVRELMRDLRALVGDA